jgi:hypothetical protein
LALHHWHSFRHSLATNLRAAGVDLKTAQEHLRHANSRITLEVYTRAISSTKREVNERVIQMMLEAGRKTISAPSYTLSAVLEAGVVTGDMNGQTLPKMAF